VEIAILKNQAEIFLGVVCPVCVFTGQAAMIFPILYFQYIRIKYVSNFFQKYAFKRIDKGLQDKLPEAVTQNFIFTSIRAFIMSYVTFNEEKKAQEKTAEPKEAFDSQPDSFRPDERAQGQGSQGDQRAAGPRAGADVKGVQLPAGASDGERKKQQDQSQRVFAAMMS